MNKNKYGVLMLALASVIVIFFAIKHSETLNIINQTTFPRYYKLASDDLTELDESQKIKLITGMIEFKKEDIVFWEETRNQYFQLVLVLSANVIVLLFVLSIVVWKDSNKANPADAKKQRG